MRYYFLCAWLIFTVGCATKPVSTEPQFTEIYKQDFTGDTIPESIQIQSSTIDVNKEFSDLYPYTFTALKIMSNERTLLTMDDQGITVENGDQVRSVITTQAAYALSLGKDDLLYIVQINNQGTPVSEPLTVNWDTENQQWLLK